MKKTIQVAISEKEKIKKIPDMIFCSPDENFTQIPNEMIRNPNLSAGAKGILCLLLSNKQGWYSYTKTIKNMMKNSDNFIRKTLVELGENGYLIRVRLRGIHTKKYGGLVWAYTGEAGIFNLKNMVKLFKKHNMEPVIDQSIIGEEIVQELIGLMGQSLDNSDEIPNAENPKWENPKWENPEMGNPPPNNTNLKNINLKNINNIYLSGETKKMKRTKPTIQERNKQFLPLAKRLADIIKLNKNININSSKLETWSEDMRKLNEIEKVDQPRINAALDWYSENIGKPYVPIIESGYSLRQKFIKLEAAIERSSGGYKNNKVNQLKSPAKIIRNTFGELASPFRKQCYVPAKRIIEGSPVDIVKNLIGLYHQIEKKQERYMTEELMNILPSPITLINNYLVWVEENDWITNKKVNMLSIENTLFSRFIREEANKDPLIRNPLTGKSYLDR